MDDSSSSGDKSNKKRSLPPRDSNNQVHNDIQETSSNNKDIDGIYDHTYDNTPYSTHYSYGRSSSYIDVEESEIIYYHDNDVDIDDEDSSIFPCEYVFGEDGMPHCIVVPKSNDLRHM